MEVFVPSESKQGAVPSFAPGLAATVYHIQQLYVNIVNINRNLVIAQHLRIVISYHFRYSLRH